MLLGIYGEQWTLFGGQWKVHDKRMGLSDGCGTLWAIWYGVVLDLRISEHLNRTSGGKLRRWYREILVWR